MSILDVLRDKEKRQAFFDVWKIIDARQKLKIYILLGVMLFNSLLEMIASGMIPIVVLVITFPERLARVPVVGEFLHGWSMELGENFIFVVCSIIILFFAFKSSVFLFLAYLQGKFLRYFQMELSKKLLDKYLFSPLEFFMSISLASFIRNINKEASTVVKDILVKILSLINDLLLSIALMSLLFISEPKASLAALGIYAIFSLIFLRGTQNKIKVYARDMLKARKNKNKVVINALEFIREIKILKKYQYFGKRYAKALNLEAKAYVQRTVFKAFPKSMFEFVGISLILGIVLFLSYQQRPQEELVAIVVLFTVVTARMRPVFVRISVSLTEMQYAIPSVKIVYNALMNTPREDFGNMTELETDFSKGSISVENATFKYSKSTQGVLNDLSLTIELGKTTALVGPSGSGKSTLINLIMGLYSLDKGDIRINGHSIKDSIPSWRDKISLIPQQIVIINDTLLNNICLGEYSEEKDGERLRKILDVCQLNEVVDSLSNGLDTKLGDRGNRLSGGQRQRVGIARALYYSRPLMIMDESTSALDGQLERYILDAIREHFPETTVITIAHRMSSIVNSDLIYVIKDGQVDSFGNYRELLETSELFRDLNSEVDQQLV